MLTTKQLAEIRERAEKATPAPWIPIATTYHVPSSLHAKTIWRIRLKNPVKIGTRRTRSHVAHHFLENDARFSAYARTDIPALLDHIQEMEEEIAKSKQWELSAGEYVRVRCQCDDPKENDLVVNCSRCGGIRRADTVTGTVIAATSTKV